MALQVSGLCAMAKWTVGQVPAFQATGDRTKGMTFAGDIPQVTAGLALTLWGALSADGFILMLGLATMTAPVAGRRCGWRLAACLLPAAPLGLMLSAAYAADPSVAVLAAMTIGAHHLSP